MILLSTAKTLRKSNRSTENGLTFPDPVKKTKCIASNDQHNCSFDKRHSSNIFSDPINLWHVVPAALISPNHTNDRYPMPNQYPQPTIHQLRTDSNPVFYSLRTVDSKRKVLDINFAFFQGNCLPDGQLNETFATVEEFSDLLIPGARVAIPPFVMKCNCF